MMTAALHLFLVLLLRLDEGKDFPSLNERHNQEKPSFFIESVFQLDDERMLELHQDGLLLLHLLQEELPLLSGLRGGALDRLYSEQLIRTELLGQIYLAESADADDLDDLKVLDAHLRFLALYYVQEILLFFA